MKEQQRPITDIASEINVEWANINPAAKPYLEAMYSLNTINDNYGCDSAKSVIAYFLSNAGSFRGETARRIKKELNDLIK